MATIRQIKVKDVVYDISPSPSGTLDTTTKDNAFASSDVAQANATAWTDVAALAATETNKSMFTKATQMMKNTRYLYNIIGTGFSTSSTIKKAIDGKAASNHGHDLSTMINGLSVGSATPEDADYYVCQYAGGGNTTSTYHRRPMSALWDYIKAKGNSTWQPKGSYAAASHTHTKSQITDFPTSLPASDVYAWAKANTKPSYSWNEITGKPSSFTAASHTHTKSQITDFPSSLKNPTSLTIQGNGTTLATYDGSAAKTVNITKGNIGLGNVDNTADSAKTVAKANQLTTTRTVSGGIDIPLSFTYNGSANSSASIGFYGCRVSQGNTNNYPFHRIGYTEVITGAYSDKSITLYITQGYQGGGFGIIRITVRTNNSNSASGAEARWLIRSGFNADQIQLGFYNVYGKTYCDIFLKTNSSYCGTVIRAIGSDARGGISRTFTLCDSTEANGTTASDAKGSKESYVSIAAAGTAIHKQAYNSIITGSDNGTVSYANSAGSCTTASKIGTGTVGANNKPVYINGGTPTACSYSLGNACSKSIRTLTAQGPSGWKDAGTDQGFVPDMAFMAYWNGAYSGSSSNLQYCDRGRFGTIVTKNAGDYAAASHTHTKSSVGLGNVDNTADTNKSVKFARETYISQYKTINLTDLNQNTWYPVTGTSVPYNGLRHFKCNVQLNSGSKPSWSTHNSGFTAVVDILEESCGWGMTTKKGIVLINDQIFINDSNKPPVGYEQMGNGSIPVWWLRGGGIYFLAADYDCTWTIQKSKYENNSQSVEPKTTYPGVNIYRSNVTVDGSTIVFV